MRIEDVLVALVLVWLLRFLRLPCPGRFEGLKPLFTVNPWTLVLLGRDAPSLCRLTQLAVGYLLKNPGLDAVLEAFKHHRLSGCPPSEFADPTRDVAFLYN